MNSINRLQRRNPEQSTLQALSHWAVSNSKFHECTTSITMKKCV